MHHTDAIRYIRAANPEQIDDILEAAIRRKRELYPGWEIIYYAEENGSTEGAEEWFRRMWEFGRLNRGREHENAWEGRESVSRENT